MFFKFIFKIREFLKFFFCLRFYVEFLRFLSVLRNRVIFFFFLKGSKVSLSLLNIRGEKRFSKIK